MPTTAFAPNRCTDSRTEASLEDRITELAAHITAATCRLLELIREFDEGQGWAGDGIQSCAHWLNWKCGIALGAAREKVRVAHALKDLPYITEQFRLGQVSYSKVRAMTRVATPENETYLLMIATHGTAAHLERLVRLYRKVQRIEALEQANLQQVERELRWHYDHDGSLVLRARLPAEQGALVVKALEAARDELFEERKDVSAETPDQDPIEPEPLDPAAARRADALQRLAESFLAGESARAGGGDRHLVHLHTDLDTLREDGQGAEAELDDATRVSAETSRRLACDCGVVHITERNGEPLNVGRKTRSIPPAIRRALDRRDRGCRFPGCSATRFTHGHHVKHWADGGETKLSNLVTLCAHHHRLVHEGGFDVRATTGGGFRFHRPDRTRLSQAPRSRFRGNVEELRDRNDREGLGIHSRTIQPYMIDDEMDYGMAVEGLISREVRSPGSRCP